MTATGPKLDKMTTEIAKRLLSMPPKHHEDMKVGRSPRKKKRGLKDRASSAKPRIA